MREMIHVINVISFFEKEFVYVRKDEQKHETELLLVGKHYRFDLDAYGQICASLPRDGIVFLKKDDVAFSLKHFRGVTPIEQGNMAVLRFGPFERDIVLIDFKSVQAEIMQATGAISPDATPQEVDMEMEQSRLETIGLAETEGFNDCPDHRLNFHPSRMH